MSGLRVITSFRTMMTLAYELGQARLSGDPERIRKAQDDHDAYKEIMLRSDKIQL